MKKNRKKWIKKLKNKKGISLTEMLASVAILGLVSVVACTELLTAYKITVKVNQASYAQTVSDMILTKISGELMNMKKGNGVYMTKEKDSPILAFWGATGVPMYICAAQDAQSNMEGDIGTRTEPGKGHLLLYYCKAKDSFGNDIKPSKWTFDDGVYMNYAIEKLCFSKIDRSGNLVIKIDLTIAQYENGEKKGSDYSTSTAVQCFYLKAQDCKTLGEENAERITGNSYFPDFVT